MFNKKIDKQKSLLFLELVHIPLWLIKDLCWLFTWRIAGLLIAIPTVLVAFIIVWITRNETSKFLPNVSIAFWIIANANWMIAEFFNFNTRFLSVIPFFLGLLVFSLFVINNIRNSDI